jgi:hypothetical protein
VVIIQKFSDPIFIPDPREQTRFDLHTYFILATLWIIRRVDNDVNSLATLYHYIMLLLFFSLFFSLSGSSFWGGKGISPGAHVEFSTGLFSRIFLSLFAKIVVKRPQSRVIR